MLGTHIVLWMTRLPNLAWILTFIRILCDIVVLRIFVELVRLDFDVVLVHDDMRVGVTLLRRLDLVHILFQDHHLFRILIVSDW